MSSMPEKSGLVGENGVDQKATQGAEMEIDAEYPGTAVQRLRSVHARVAQLTRAQLDADWPSVRRALLWAGKFRHFLFPPPFIRIPLFLLIPSCSFLPSSSFLLPPQPFVFSSFIISSLGRWVLSPHNLRVDW
jgi:hypothetical protein